MCRWQIQVSEYCARRRPAHLRCTQCSILLHLIAIYFILCICLWQISKIQTCVCVVVGPGFVSTSPTSMGSRASHPAGPHFPKKRLIGREVSTQFAQQFVTAPPLLSCVVWSHHQVCYGARDRTTLLRVPLLYRK